VDVVYETEREEMVDRLISYGYLRQERIITAMRKVPRHLFVPSEHRRYAYEDIPLPAGGNQTISAPHMVAMMCEYLELEEGQKVLEIGAGTGYHACIVANIITPGKVYTVERLPSLAKRAERNLKEAGCPRVKVIVADGTLGYPEEAPYDRIYVTAGAPEVPYPLLEQLGAGGRILIPLGSRYSQELVLMIKRGKKIERKNLCGCSFVPLIGEHGWKE
jgi:protein-L-isoaspartate(D-aspartate) O-methyltransferase